MIIGYTVFAPDNGSDMIPEGEVDNQLVCSKCQLLLEPYNYFNPFFRLKKKSYDLSFTYDNRQIVSLKFKEFCMRQNYKGLQFKELEREPYFYQLIVENILAFDSIRRGTSFNKYCSVCDNFEEIIGATLAFIKGVNKELEEGFYRTDLAFSWGNNKYPLLVVAPLTHDKLKMEKLKGIVFEPIVN